MKKILIILTVVCLICGCGSETSTEPDNTQKVVKDVCKTMYHESSYIIGESEEMEAYYLLDNVVDYNIFYEKLKEMEFSNTDKESKTDSFFKENVIVIIPRVEVSGSTTLNVESVDLDEITKITVDRYISDAPGTCDMKSYMIELEISKEYLGSKDIEIVYEDVEEENKDKE